MSIPLTPVGRTATAARRNDDALHRAYILASLTLAIGGGFALAVLLPLAQAEEWDWGRYWPALVLIASVAFFAQWFSRPSERGLLAPAFLALVVGGVALPITLRVVNPRLANMVIKF